jgi:hypothetical protein
MSEFLATDPEVWVRFQIFWEVVSLEQGPQKLALTFPTSSGPSVSIVRSQTKVMELL